MEAVDALELDALREAFGRVGPQRRGRGARRSLAADLAPTRVDAVATGVVATGVWDDEGRKGLREWARALPVGHLGEPEELTDAYRFPMTATSVTGVVLPVDGGIACT